MTNALTGKAIAGAMVEVEGLGITTFTDSTGFFSIDSLEPGSHNLLFYHESVEPVVRNDVYIAGQAEKRVDVEMSPATYALDKVLVRGSSFQRPPDLSASAKLMNFDEIVRAPGALLDVQRAVQDLPSVSSGADNTNEIVVRGGVPGENLLIMDNIEIPNPNHFADQGSGGGVISLINPLLVKGLTFSAGAPPAQYGGKASSVLDVKLREGNDRMLLGGVDLGLAGAGFHAEGPLWKGATFMTSAQKSFLDLVASYEQTTAVPRYWGIQTKVAQNVGSQKISGNLIYGDNQIVIADARDQIGTDGERIESGGGVYAAGVNWEAFWGEHLSSLVTVSGVGNGFERLEYSEYDSAGVRFRDSLFVNNSFEREQAARAQLTLALGSNNRVQVGGGIKRCDFEIAISGRPDTLREYTSAGPSGSVVHDSLGNPIVWAQDAASREVAWKYGAFVSSVVSPLSRVRLIPGVRADYFTFNKSLSISPRLGAVVSVSRLLDLSASAGIQYQDPDYADLVAAPANGELPGKRAITGIVGAEYLVERNSTKLVVETFVKKYDNLPVDSSVRSDIRVDKSDVLLPVGEGRSYGIELFVQKKLVRDFFYTLAYSWSRAENRDPRPGRQSEWYRGEFDFGNAFTCTGGYRTDLTRYGWYRRVEDRWWMAALSPVMPIADRLEVSLRWRFLGGRPYTGLEFDPVYRRWAPDTEGLNGARYDDYHRLDFRFERRFGFGFLQMIYYFDLQNIYNKDNIWTYIYSDRFARKTPIYQFHFFPAGGVIIGF